AHACWASASTASSPRGRCRRSRSSWAPWPSAAGCCAMRDTLRAGLRHTFTYRVPATKLVPTLFPEAAEFQAMPRVFATGYLVGLVEWTCIQAVNPHLDWPREQ